MWLSNQPGKRLGGGGDLLEISDKHGNTCLWAVEQHAAQFVAGIRLHVGIGETAQLVPGSHLETLWTQQQHKSAPGPHTPMDVCVCTISPYLDGLFGVEQTFVNGTEQQVLEACAGGVVDPLQHCGGKRTSE